MIYVYVCMYICIYIAQLYKDIFAEYLEDIDYSNTPSVLLIWLTVITNVITNGMLWCQRLQFWT